MDNSSLKKASIVQTDNIEKVCVMLTGMPLRSVLPADRALVLAAPSTPPRVMIPTTRRFTPIVEFPEEDDDPDAIFDNILQDMFFF